MAKNYVLCGMQFGDEGKGTFVDYLVHQKNANAVVRYNGGSQASHTVVTPEGMIHKFACLGSGMFYEGCHTYLSENMVVNPENLIVELHVFSMKTGIPVRDLLKRLHIHGNCLIVTPYHKLINRMRELANGKNRRGSVGTGVSEVKFLLENEKIQIMPLMFKHLFEEDTINIRVGLYQLEKYATKFYEENRHAIWENCPGELFEPFFKEINFLIGYVTRMGVWSKNSHIVVAEHYRNKFLFAREEYNFRECIFYSYDSIFDANNETVVFEGSQGLLIDHKYGIKPNTTHLDTTNVYASKIIYNTLGVGRSDATIKKIGIVKAFCSRHGLGIFPTESAEISERISDENQEATFWNGRVRFGWLDLVLLRYANFVNLVDELFVSSVDLLDDFDTIKICNSYIYKGNIDEKFKELFVYEINHDGEVMITDIRAESEDFGSYLVKCSPKYVSFEGWKVKTSDCSTYEELPKRCVDYIKFIEHFTYVPVTLVSVGPTRNHKIVFDV